MRVVHRSKCFYNEKNATRLGGVFASYRWLMKITAMAMKITAAIIGRSMRDMGWSPFSIGKIFMTAQGTGRVIEVVLDTAVRAGFLGQVAGFVLAWRENGFCVHIGAVELQLSALTAAENGNLQSAGNQVRPVT